MSIRTLGLALLPILLNTAGAYAATCENLKSNAVRSSIQSAH